MEIDCVGTASDQLVTKREADYLAQLYKGDSQYVSWSASMSLLSCLANRSLRKQTSGTGHEGAVAAVLISITLITAKALNIYLTYTSLTQKSKGDIPTRAENAAKYIGGMEAYFISFIKDVKRCQWGHFVLPNTELHSVGVSHPLDRSHLRVMKDVIALTSCEDPHALMASDNSGKFNRLIIFSQISACISSKTKAVARTRAITEGKKGGVSRLIGSFVDLPQNCR
eukprot:5926394-Amphidinium_carterae.1